MGKEYQRYRRPNNRALRHSLSGIMFVVLTASLSAADLSMQLSVNRRNIYIGESLQLTVRIRGLDRAVEPSLTGIRDADIRFLGSHVQSHVGISIVNNRREQAGYTERIYAYAVTPRRTGRLVVGPVTLEADGERIRQPGIAVQVRGVDDQDHVVLSISSMRESVLVGEPFEVETTILLKQLSAPYTHHNPLDPREPPRLELPYLELTPIEGLEPPDVRQLLQEHLVQNPAEPGFALNNFTVSSDRFGFGLLSNERTATFMFDPRTVMRNGKPYFAYSIKLSYLPTKEGSYTFGPAVFKGKVVTNVRRGGYVETDAIFAIGPALTVNVVPPPEANRPACFVGAIGTNLTVATQLDAQVCNVGDPLTMTVDISGSVRFENIVPPRLSQQAAITNDFRIYDNTIRTEAYADGRRYRYTVRPTRVGTYEFPPVEIGYFDLASRHYRIVRSAPIPLQASGIADVDISDLVGFRTNAADTIHLSVSTAADVVAPMTMSPRGAQPAPLIHARQVLLLAAAGPGFLLLTIGVQGTVAWRRRRRSTRGTRTALSTARRQLRAMRSMQDRHGTDHALRRILGGFLAERFGVRSKTMTPQEAARLLDSVDAPAALRQGFLGLFEAAFNNAFAGDTADAQHDASRCCDQAETVMAALDRHARTRESVEQEAHHDD